MLMWSLFFFFFNDYCVLWLALSNAESCSLSLQVDSWEINLRPDAKPGAVAQHRLRSGSEKCLFLLIISITMVIHSWFFLFPEAKCDLFPFQFAKTKKDVKGHCTRYFTCLPPHKLFFFVTLPRLLKQDTLSVSERRHVYFLPLSQSHTSFKPLLSSLITAASRCLNVTQTVAGGCRTGVTYTDQHQRT